MSSGQLLQFLVLLLGGGGGLTSVIVTVIKARGQATGDAASLKQKIANQIDARVEHEFIAMRKEIADLKQKVTDVTDSEKRTRRENEQIKIAVKRWFRDLVLWNRAGRPGAIPLPSQEDLDLLDLDPNAPTLSRAELDELRDAPA